MAEEFYKKQIEEKEDREESSKKSLKEQVEENNKLLKRLLETDGVKKVKFKKLGKSQKKKGYVNYLYIRENGEIEALKVPIMEMTTVIEEAPRLAQPEHILNYKGSPTIIQPAWSSIPFSTVDNYKEAEQKDMLSTGWRLLANRAELGNIKPKKKISGTAIFFIIIALLVAGYLILF